MAGEKGKGKRSSAQEHHGGEERGEKGKRSLAQEHRGGEERGPKIRKVTQEEMGKRKGKLQIKERDKPMELEKMRRLEEDKGKKPKLAPASGDGAEEDESRKMMKEKKIAFFKTVLEKDCDGQEIPEYAWPFFEGGLAELKALNECFRTSVKEFKEFAAWCLKEEFNIDFHSKVPSNVPSDVAIN